MSLLQNKLNALGQKSQEWIKSASHQIEKWQFQAKKRFLGVSLADDIRHKFKCAKHEISQQKREIDTNFSDFATKFADKISEKLNKPIDPTEKLNNWKNSFYRYDEKIRQSANNLPKKMTKWLNRNKNN